MVRLIEKEFVVDASIEIAWQHLSQIENWTTWAKHIKHIELDPPGKLTQESTVTFHLKNGVKSTFLVTEFNPPENWKWAGKFLWLTINYDHRFEPVENQRTKLVWIVDCTGFAATLVGRLFALVYELNLNKAISLLQAEMKSSCC